MNADFWNQKFDGEEFCYGTKPNKFFQTILQDLDPGKLLLPGEGEGRNAVFAACAGWRVDAFDSSEVGKQKALAFAKKRSVEINYQIDDYQSFTPEKEAYDVVGLIFTHAEPSLRKALHQKVIESLKVGGIVILETFNPQQLQHHSGGPKNIEMLYTDLILREDFKSLQMEQLEMTSTLLDEGPGHQGLAQVTRMVARKIN